MKKKIIPILATLLLCALFVQDALAAADEYPDFTYDIRSMIQMNPDFSTYTDAGAPDGVIWLKRVHCGIAPKGGAERQTMWVLLGREGLPSKWLSWNLPVPEGGEAEFLEASVYSPESAEKINTAMPVNSLNGALRTVSFSDLPENFILVVHYREVFPEELSVDGLVWTSESLPVWETEIRVTVPSGHPFYHASSQKIDPEEESVYDRMVYEWHVVNTAAEVHPSIRASDREYVSFGSRDDRRVFGRFIRAAEEAALPPPGNVRDMFADGSAEAAENILKWVYDQPGIVLTSEPRAIPEEAPWTAREKVLLAHNWLKEGGINSRLFWRMAYAPEDGKPACQAALIAPVLEVSPSDSKTVSYCDMESQPKLSGNESMLEDIVYGLQAASDRLEERQPAPRRASDNNLSARFDLKLSDDGILAGAVQITARRAWRQFMFPQKPSSDDLDALIGDMFAKAPRYGEVTFKETGSENIVTAALLGVQAIKGTDGSHIMVPPPPMIPRWLKGLTSGPFPYDLSFPFTMDVRMVTELPARFANALLPSPVNMNAGEVRYSESYKLDKKRIFVAEASMTVDTTLIEGDTAAALGTAIENWQTFMTRYLPVRLNAR